MKWVEAIVLRSINEDLTSLESKLRGLLDAVRKDPAHPKMRICRRALIDSDFCIYLEHESGKTAGSGSPLGVRLASALKEFGLVNHSTWIEMR